MKHLNRTMDKKCFFSQASRHLGSIWEKVSIVAVAPRLNLGRKQRQTNHEINFLRRTLADKHRAPIHSILAASGRRSDIVAVNWPSPSRQRCSRQVVPR
mmetsp:Transcript_42271/g.83633  ORF Transcript_42271/g.83633 Transcript_42271/m.83633 type:complete len:99 (+) Transcript_42271:56-352(+)